MPNIDSIVNVSISRQTQAASLPGFGIPCILGTSGNWPVTNSNKIATYTSLSALAVDYSTSTPEYAAASAIFSQTPKPASIRVAKRTAAVAQVNTLTPVVQNATLYTVTIDGVTYSFTSSGSATATNICAGLLALINADSNCRMLASGSTTLILTSTTVGYASTLAASANLTIVNTTANNGCVEDILAAQQQDNSWYMIANTSKAVNDQLALAAWVETQKKMQICLTNDANCGTSASTDLASLMKNKNYSRTAVYYSSTAAEWGSAAWMGRALPTNPGSETWKFKSLAGITPELSINDSQIGFMDGKNCNYEIQVAGLNITAQGKVSGGDFIDTIRGIDWLQAQIQADIFTKLSQLDKIPFTDTGIAVIEASLRAQLMAGERVGLLVPGGWSVSVPKAAAISVQDRAARNLTGITFVAQIAGAIHSTTINGTVTV